MDNGTNGSIDGHEAEAEADFEAEANVEADGAEARRADLYVITEAERTVEAAWTASLTAGEAEAAAVLLACRHLCHAALTGLRDAQVARDPVRIAAAHLVLIEADEMLKDCTAVSERLHVMVVRERLSHRF